MIKKYVKRAKTYESIWPLFLVWKNTKSILNNYIWWLKPCYRLSKKYLYLEMVLLLMEGAQIMANDTVLSYYIFNLAFLKEVFKAMSTFG